MKKRFSKEDKIYFNYINHIKRKKIDKLDFIYQFPVFVGDVNIARLIFLYEIYKKVQNLSGHIADIGTWKGASFFSFAKFVKIFEKYSQTRVYGFDWFKGMKPGKNDDMAHKNKYGANYNEIMKMIKIQNLDEIAIIKKMNLINEFENFIRLNRWLRFKVAFIDCGIEKVLKNTIRVIWPRIVKKGILILDHYNNSASPMESEILEKVIGKNTIKQMSFVRQPTAFVEKKY